MMFRTLVFVAFVCTASALLPFKLTDCNNSPNKIIKLANPQLSNVNPVHIPGNETISIDIQILQPISGAHHKVELTILKKVLFGYVIVPCYDDPSQNSCTYELCDVLYQKDYNNTNHCPVEILDTSPNFQCACPFSPGTYSLNPTSFEIGELSAGLKFLAQGDYKAHGIITDTNTNEQVACYDLQISTGADCSGISCLIG